jgi:hypothetical protein
MTIFVVCCWGVCNTVYVMKKAYLTVNYNARVQVFDGANADEILDYAVINAIHPEIEIVDFQLDDGRVTVDPENPDFFKLDVRMKVVVQYSDGELEDIVEGGLEFDMDGLFSVWDWEVYGWGIEDVK